MLPLSCLFTTAVVVIFVLRIYFGGCPTHTDLERQELLVMEKFIPECLLRLVVL